MQADDVADRGQNPHTETSKSVMSTNQTTPQQVCDPSGILLSHCTMVATQGSEHCWMTRRALPLHEHVSKAQANLYHDQLESL